MKMKKSNVVITIIICAVGSVAWTIISFMELSNGLMIADRDMCATAAVMFGIATLLLVVCAWSSLYFMFNFPTHD